MKIVWTAIAVSASLTIAGCNGSTSPTSTTTTTTTTPATSTRVVKANPSFATDIQEIFERRNCTNSGCHGSAVSAGLDLRAGVSFGALVNAPSTLENGVRVIPGDPDASYLVVKLEGRQTTGTSMPQGAPPLDATDLANIRNWIATGAPNN